MTFDVTMNRAAPAPETAPALMDLAPTIALFLDLDGVLAPLMPSPEMVKPEPARTQRLKALLKPLDGRVAILSGRTIKEVDRICEGVVTAVAGVHGLELRQPDGTIRREDPEQVQAVFEDMVALASRHPRLMIENKNLSIGIHYRHAPELEDKVRRFVTEQAAAHDLAVQFGHFVAEIRPKGRTKGDALTYFMEQSPFQGAMPVVLGDDQTDEHAFAAAQALGGVAIRVSPDGPTQAGYSLSGPDAVAQWLQAYVEASGRAA